MNAQDMKISLACHNQSGITPPHSARDVAQASIQSDNFSCDVKTIKALCAILDALLYETLSEDKISLTLRRARNNALHDGLSLEEWEKIQKVVSCHWLQRRNENPLSRMF